MKIAPKNIHLNPDISLELPELPAFSFVVPEPEKKEQITVYTGKKDKSKSLF